MLNRWHIDCIPMVLQWHIDAPGLVPGQLRASFGGGHWEGREFLFSRIPYLGGVSFVPLRFGASFGPDRSRERDRCLSGRLAWWCVFMAKDDRGREFLLYEVFA